MYIISQNVPLPKHSNLGLRPRLIPSLDRYLCTMGDMKNWKLVQIMSYYKKTHRRTWFILYTIKCDDDDDDDDATTLYTRPITRHKRRTNTHNTSYTSSYVAMSSLYVSTVNMYVSDIVLLSHPSTALLFHQILRKIGKFWWVILGTS